MEQLDLDLGHEALRRKQGTLVCLPETIRRDLVARMADIIVAVVMGHKPCQKPTAARQTQEETHE
jgi:hypothetical protein